MTYQEILVELSGSIEDRRRKSVEQGKHQRRTMGTCKILEDKEHHCYAESGKWRHAKDLHYTRSQAEFDVIPPLAGLAVELLRQRINRLVLWRRLGRSLAGLLHTFNDAVNNRPGQGVRNRSQNRGPWIVVDERPASGYLKNVGVQT